MRVEYTCGLNRASEWICFEHEGFARSKAIKWWKERMGTAYPAPVSVTHAIAAANGIPKPKAITVITSGNYPQITGYDFNG